MACKFSCFLNYSEAVNENEVVLFYLDAHDTYTVKYKTNNQRELLLLIKWTASKQVLVTVELCSVKNVQCFAAVRNLVDGKQMCLKIREASKFQTISNYNILCIITVVPHIVTKCARSTEENYHKVGKFVNADCQAKTFFGKESDDFQKNATDYPKTPETCSFQGKNVPYNDDIWRSAIGNCEERPLGNECISTDGIEILQTVISKAVPPASNTELLSNLESKSLIYKGKGVSDIACQEISGRRHVFHALTDERNVSSSEDINKNLANETVAVHNVIISNYFVKLQDVTDCIFQSLVKMALALYQKIPVILWKSRKTKKCRDEQHEVILDQL